MSSRDFAEDFRKAQKNDKPAGILNIRRGDCDVEFELLFSLPSSKYPPFKIHAAVQNVADYPNDHEYIVFCVDDPPPQIEDALEKISGKNQTILSEFLKLISETLSNVCLSSKEDCLYCVGEQEPVGKQDSLSTTNDQDLKRNEEPTCETEGAEMLKSDDSLGSSDESTKSSEEDYVADDDDFLSSSNAKERLLADMRLTKEAGFVITDLGSLWDCNEDSHGYLTISVPMSELGIHEEVMQAWEVDLNEHLILIIHYPKDYKTYEELQEVEGLSYDKKNVGMRVVAGKNPTVTLHEANIVFKNIKNIDRQNVQNSLNIREILVSKQLTTLLEERLLPILQLRSCGLDWHGAESWYSDLLEMNETAPTKVIPDKYFVPETNDKVFPHIVTADHFTSQCGASYSFPLLAMQFVLRHFVRCTEFCLICHRKLNLELEAIKPYFCERPLCLFQSVYLNTGFIEHEIMSQPYVVDLLVSFCYASARSHKLKKFPDGLALMVPYNFSGDSSSDSRRSSKTVEYNVGFDYDKLEVNFWEKPVKTCPVKENSWIVIKFDRFNNGIKTDYHCRVSGTSSYPIITVDEPVTQSNFSKLPGAPSDESSNKGTLTLYNVDFDELGSWEKCDVICTLLDTLPTVKEMQNYLTDRNPGELQNWVQRLSPAALRLFQWIIVTNRACIKQVDGDTGSKAKQERLFGMKGYMQFRFAMGAPDKERRFLNEIRQTAKRLKLKYPTLFAFHGSPLYNWHMIIREGLHFNTTLHGRSYGNGVYHAKDAATSESYSQTLFLKSWNDSTVHSWTKSVLKISLALALNEIVNAPGEFVSSNPYYVVSQLDWIQTRYLLVKCSPVTNVINVSERKPSNRYPQDPNLTPTGTSGPIIIPASAIKDDTKSRKAFHKKRKKKKKKKVQTSKGDLMTS